MIDLDMFCKALRIGALRLAKTDTTERSLRTAQMSAEIVLNSIAEAVEVARTDKYLDARDAALLAHVEERLRQLRIGGL